MRARPLSGVRLDVALCAVVVLVYLVVQIILLPGPQPYDPAYYFQQAAHFPDVHANAWTLRIGLMVPLTLLVHMFGQSELTFYALPIASSAALAVAAYFLVRFWFADRVLAVCSALVLVLNEDYLANSSALFPDVLAAATFTIGFLLLVLARPRLDDEESPAWLSRPDHLAVAAGLFFGWSYLIREFSPILLPAVVLALWLLHFPRRRVVAVAAGSAVGLVVELLYATFRYGNPVKRLQVLTQSGASVAHPQQWEPYFHRVHNIFEAAYVFPRMLLTWRTGWPILGLLIVLLVGAVLLRDRRIWLLAGWLGFFWAAMTLLGTLRSSGGAPRLGIAYERYWVPVLPALFLGGMAAAFLLVCGRDPTAQRRRTAQLCVVALAAVVLVPGITEYSQCRAKDVWYTQPATRWDQLRSWLAAKPAHHYDRLLADRTSVRLVRIYAASPIGRRVWPGDIIGLPDQARAVQRDAHRTLVLVDRRQGLDEWLPTVAALGGSWTPTFVSSDGVLAVLALVPPVPGDAATQARWSAPPDPRHIVDDTCGVSPYTTH